MCKGPNITLMYKEISSKVLNFGETLCTYYVNKFKKYQIGIHSRSLFQDRLK